MSVVVGATLFTACLVWGCGDGDGVEHWADGDTRADTNDGVDTAETILDDVCFLEKIKDRVLGRLDDVSGDGRWLSFLSNGTLTGRVNEGPLRENFCFEVDYIVEACDGTSALVSIGERCPGAGVIEQPRFDLLYHESGGILPDEDAVDVNGSNFRVLGWAWSSVLDGLCPDWNCAIVSENW